MMNLAAPAASGVPAEIGNPSSGLILEGALKVTACDQRGFGVMIFPDNIFKCTSNMIKHIPELQP